MYKDVEEKLAKQKGAAFTDKYIKGLPFGLKLSNGVIIGE
jgi:salicylate hydroxylase